MREICHATPEFVEDDGEVYDKSLIPQEDMVVTVSHAEYISVYFPPTAHSVAARGALKGTTKDEDFVSRIVANTHQPVLFSQPPALFTK